MTAEMQRAAAVAVSSSLLLAGAGLAGIGAVVALAWLFVIVLACVSPVGVLLGSIAALPYFYRPLELPGPQFAASELLLVAALFGAAFRIVVGQPDISTAWSDFRRRVGDLATSPIVIAAVFIAILGGVLVAFPFDASHRAESLREWRWTLAEPAILVGLLVWHRGCRWLPGMAALALISGATVASLHALADFAIGGGVSVGGVTRIAGPYPHPNALALMMVRVAAFAFVWAFLDPRARRWIAPLLLVCAVAAAATFSRGAMLAGLVAVALVLTQAPSRVRLVGIGSIAAGLLLAVALARDRMLDLFGGGSGSLRLDIWSSALQMINDRPVRGYGPDQFLYAYLPRYVQPTAWNERFTAHAHNFMLDFWIRLSIIGAAFAGFVVLICLITLARRMQSSDRHLPIELAALIALTAVFAHGVVDNAYFSHDLAMSCWLLAWLAFGTRSAASSDERGVEIASSGIGWGRLHWLTSLR